MTDETKQAEDQAQAPEGAIPETVNVQSMDQFARLLVNWHGNRVARLQHMLTVPEGMEVMIGEDKLVLTGDVLKAFRLAVNMALSEIGQLPFVFEMEEPDANAGSPQ